MRTLPRPRSLDALAAAILITLSLVACRRAQPTPSLGQQGTSESDQATIERTLLYPDGDDLLLTPLTVPMATRGNPHEDMSEVMSRYIAGPCGEDQVQPFPEHCALKSLFSLGAGRVVLDLTGPVREGGGSDTETARVYGLIDTLAWNFPDVKSVQILVDGREVDTLMGHLDLSRPLPPEPGMMSPLLRQRSEGASAGQP
jgi:spore germination protein GerM